MNICRPAREGWWCRLHACVQVDTHVNNQYNTCFWALRKSGRSGSEAQEALRGTLTGAKNEMLFSHFSINYNNLPARVRKGSVVIWEQKLVAVKELADGSPVMRLHREPLVVHEDIIGDVFWEQHPEILGNPSPGFTYG
jgi:tRNA(His) guanylyltransferase